MTKLSGNVENFTFAVEGAKIKFKLAKIEGGEGISLLFRYTLELVSEDSDLDFSQIVGKTSVVKFISDHDEIERYIHGVIADFALVDQGERLTTYIATLVPRVWNLTQMADCRIFQKQSTPDIIKKILDDAKIPSDTYKIDCKETYAARDYCVQYRESDWSFISRLMEEEGIFYYFEHSAAKHVLMIADKAVVHQEIGAPAKVLYQKPSGTVADEDTVHPFSYSEGVRSGSVVLTDYLFRKPALNLKQKQDYKLNAELEVYDTAGRYPVTDLGDDADATGARLAKVRLEAAQVSRVGGSGSSDCMRFTAGYRFTLAQHGRKTLNQDYLLTYIHMLAEQPNVYEENAGEKGSSYTNTFTCIPASVPYRAGRIAEKPIIPGAQTAIVTGPAGEEIYVDEFGRVKVQFHWDREGKSDEKSSCWLRVSQVWAGAGWGAMFIPRIGQEVIVEFLEGDPDRPMITGRVYHGTNKPPYALPDEKTKSTLRSNTSPNCDTHNELLLEDKQGKTQVVLSNAYGHKIIQDEETQALTLHTRDNNKIRLDDKSKNIFITTTNGHQCLLDDANKKIVIKSKDDQSIQLLDDDENIITVQTKNKRMFTLNDKDKKIETVSENGHAILISDADKMIAVQTSKGNMLALDDKNGVIKVESSDGKLSLKFDVNGGKIVVENSSGDIKFSAPGGKFSVEALDIELTASKDVKIKGNMNLDCEAGVQANFKGTMVTTEASAIMTVKGSLIKIN